MKMVSFLKRKIAELIGHVGYEIRRKAAPAYPGDFTPAEINVLEKVHSFTMTSAERLVALMRAIDYVSKYNIPGDIVECGVWRGGSMMAAAMTLIKNQKADRNLYLFDTFAGMSEPTEHDISLSGRSAIENIEEEIKNTTASLDQVKRNLKTTGYESEKIHYIVGKVEDTIPQHAPKTIAILRLDTDWYESTRHELLHLFPRLSSKGVLIIDDYGHWMGSKKAVDEYLETNNLRLFLNRIDYTGRLIIKSANNQS